MAKSVNTMRVLVFICRLLSCQCLGQLTSVIPIEAGQSPDTEIPLEREQDQMSR